MLSDDVHTKSDCERSLLTETEARRLYETGDSAHDFDHVVRVTRLAVKIAAAEGADITVVRLAALLHDVPPSGNHTAEEGRTVHHVAAAAVARSLLGARGLSPERLNNVVHAIEAHRFRDSTTTPQTLEACCVYDADKLDSIGAIGIGRAFAFAGSRRHRLWSQPWTTVSMDLHERSSSEYTPVHEYRFKLNRILGTLHTDTAHAIGAQRHAFMATFFDQLDAEMQGFA